ncbi:MAG: VWA domain-containing protein [Vicinamibacterales bacterium]
MLRRPISLFLGVTAAVVSLSAQTPPPPEATTTELPPVVFRVQVDYVEVDVAVTGELGRPLRGLTREDFELFEDRVPQKVDLFSYVDIPVTQPDRPLYSPAPIEPDVATNAPLEGRLYVLLLDDLQTHVLRSQLVKRAARQFVERYMGANDLAAVVHLSGRADSGQDFTANKRLLLAAVDKFMGRKLQSSTIGRMERYQQQQALGASPSRIADPDAFERGYNARRSLESVENMAKFLEGIRGRRKALLYFSEGIDYDINNPFESTDATVVLDATRSAIGAAARANVAIYGIDPRGLTTLGDDTIEMSGSIPDDPAYGIGPGDILDELRRSQDSLRVLSDETGGTAVVNSNGFANAFARIVTDNSSYYVLGYHPTNDKRDGRLRKIDVRVKRPGVQVRSRTSYVAPRGRPAAPSFSGVPSGTSDAVRDTLASPIPTSGLGMAVTAAAFKGEDRKASVLVTVQMDSSRFKFTEQGGQSREKIEVSLVALDATGRVQGGARQTADLALRPQTRQAVERAGFRMTARLSLSPGPYQLRVGAGAAGAEIAGAAHFDLEVPDFDAQPMSISGLVLSSNLAGVTPTATPDAQLQQLMKTPPTTWRDFSVADTLWTFAEIYDTEGRTSHKVDIRTELRSDDGRIVFKSEDQRTSDELRGARGGFGHLVQIPLKDIAPGTYALRVEAQSTLGGRAPVRRETMLRVWPLPQAAAAAVPKTVVSVARGTQSDTTNFRTVVARTEAEWQTLYASLGLRQTIPKVNFETTMIVAVFLGSRPTPGYSVDILDARREGDTLVVQYAEREPPADSIQADVITNPFVVAGVPATSDPLRFEKVPPRP